MTFLLTLIRLLCEPISLEELIIALAGDEFEESNNDRDAV